MNKELLWKRIFKYVGYSKISTDEKAFIDHLYKNIYETLEYNNQKTDGVNADFVDMKLMSPNDYIEKYSYWILDNPLQIAFVGAYACHEILRPYLLMLHLYKNKKLNKKFMTDSVSLFPKIHLNKSMLADFYTCLGYGIYESGAEVEKGERMRTIIVSNDYSFSNNHPKKLLEYYELQRVSMSEKKYQDEFKKAFSDYF